MYCKKHDRQVSFVGRSRVLLGQIFMASALTALPVVGQSAVLEEIFVTASKRGQTNLQETAVTATVITAEQLKTRDIRNVSDLQFLTPGLIVDDSAAAPKVSIRGVGYDASLIHAENGVAVYTDDVIIQRAQAITAAFFDLERVDVLKGPQGTSFGRNANGGSVNYISQRPVEGTEGEAGIGFGSFGKQTAYGIFNQGSEKYGFRIGAKHHEDDGFAKNLTTGEDINGKESTTVKGSFSFAPTEDFEGIFRATYFDEDFNGPAVTVVSAEPFSLPALFGGTPAFDPNENYEVQSDLGNRQQSEITTASLHLDWDIGELNLRSITGYQDGDFIIQNDADHSNLPFVDVPFNDFVSDQFSQEFILSGSAGDKMDWLVGAYYLTEEVTQDVDIDFLLPLSPAGVSVNMNDTQDLTSKAVFAQGIWNISDTTRLIAGVRYTEDNKEIDYDQEIVLGPLAMPAFNGLGIDFTGIIPAAFVPGLSIPTCQESFDETWDDTTWDLTLERNLSDESFAYAKVNTGFKAGGYNNTACDTGYEPEQITAYEIGYKGTFNDGGLILSTSAFYYDYEDIQVLQVEAFPGVSATTAVVDNAAEAEVYGIDIELRAALTDNISADVGLSWVPTAEYKEFFSVDALDLFSIDGDPLTTPATLDLSGNRLNRAPEYSATLGLNYESDLGSSGWNMKGRLELYIVDDIAFSPFDRPNSFSSFVGLPGLVEDANIQAGYELLNAYLSFNYGDDWTVSLYGKNLTDEYYLTGIIENPGPQHIHGDFGRPREFGVQLVYRFSKD